MKKFSNFQKRIEARLIIPSLQMEMGFKIFNPKCLARFKKSNRTDQLMKLYFFLLSCLICSFMNAQPSTAACHENLTNCPRHGRPHPDYDLTSNPVCDISDREEKCVKIKFHYINNTNGPDMSPTDQEFAVILDKINETYKQAKIKFDFAGECIHRRVQPIITTDPHDLFNKVRDPSTPFECEPDAFVDFWQPGDQEYDADMGYVKDYINVYFCNNIENVGDYLARMAVVTLQSQAIFDFPIHAVHEIGHAMGLEHTNWPYTKGSTQPRPLDCYYKDLSILNPLESPPTTPLCKLVQDCLCDTGLDPYALDLKSSTDNGDNKLDGAKWVVNGKQIAALTPNYYDGRDDRTTAWDIPANNIMSYYISNFRNRFSNCQIALMHDFLENERANLVMTCNNSDLYGICDDIIIDENSGINGEVEWTGTHYLCRNQKIIIKRGGSLTLNNARLTAGDLPDPPSGNCQDLIPFQLWPGIVLDNTDFEIQGEPKLYVKNYSVIENAVVAISIPTNMGVVGLKDSKIRNCIRMIDAVDHTSLSTLLPGPTIYPLGNNCSNESTIPTIVINNCQLTTDDIVNDLGSYVSDTDNQIKLNGVSIILENGSSIKNNNTSRNYIAINSSRGKVKIINGSSIEGYGIGVYKDEDLINLCTPWGMEMRHSNIKNCSLAIKNLSSNLLLSQNYFSGRVESEGISYSLVFANTFSSNSAALLINYPQRSMIIKENHFINPYVTIQGNNGMTELLCNSWIDNNFNTALEISYNSTVPGAWGDKFYVSGNIESPADDDLLFDFTPDGMLSDEIFNHFKNGEANQIFTYSGWIFGAGHQFIGDNCNHNLAPLVSPVFDENWIESPDDLDSLEMIYSTIDSIIGVYYDQLSHLNGEDATNKNNQIQHLKIDLDDIVRRALTVAELSDSSVINNWLERVSPKLLDLSRFLSMWYNREFEDLSDELDQLGDDANTLSDASDYMNSLVNENRSIYELSKAQIDTLSDIAQSSYGDYTKLLRTFLNSEYDLLIIRPDSIQPRGSNLNTSPKINKYDFSEKYTIVPNPTKGCIRISTKNNKQNEFNIVIFNSFGMLIRMADNTQSNDSICIDGEAPGIYWIRIADPMTGYSETHKIILN